MGAEEETRTRTQRYSTSSHLLNKPPASEVGYSQQPHMDAWKLMTGTMRNSGEELEADFSRPLERLGFGRVSYGTCASGKILPPFGGAAWLYAQLRQNLRLPTSTIALDPPINFEVSKEP